MKSLVETALTCLTESSFDTEKVKGSFKVKETLVYEFQDQPKKGSDHAREEIEKAIISQGETYIVRDKQNNIVAAMTLAPPEDDITIMDIGSIEPGAGSVLIQLAAKRALSKKLPLKLGAHPDAIGFYKKLGFTSIKSSNTSGVTVMVADVSQLPDIISGKRK